jgi:hypothetical protein
VANPSKLLNDGERIVVSARGCRTVVVSDGT